MKKLNLSALALIIAFGAVAATKIKRAPTTFYFNKTSITETATAYKTALNWQTAPVSCGSGSNLACQILSTNASNTTDLVTEIENSGINDAQEISYVRGRASSFKP